MMQRSFTWLVFLVLLLLAGLLLVDWQDTLGNKVALIEVDNQSGLPLQAIETRWADGAQHWPGLEPGESALISLVVEQPGEVNVEIQPGGADTRAVLKAGQRFYVKVTPQGIDAQVHDDPSLARKPRP